MLAAILSLTNFGNWIKSTGGQIEAAAAMGIPTDAVKMICFMLCSVLAGFAGMIQVLRLGSPLPSIGEGLELQAVAAAVIGGTSLYGGVGTVLGAIVGALLIRVIDNGLVLSPCRRQLVQVRDRLAADPRRRRQRLASAHVAPHQAGDLRRWRRRSSSAAACTNGTPASTR